MKVVKDFARDTATKAGLEYSESEYVLDFVAFEKNPIELVASAESEASTIQDPMDTLDLDKLLLVRSPLRIYVGRANVTKTGNAKKLHAAQNQIHQRCTEAHRLGLIQPNDVVCIVLLQTTSAKTEIFHWATFDTTNALLVFAKQPP
jgi:hypothetical protein